MMISRALVAAAFVAAGAATAVAGPFPRPMGMAMGPGFAPWHGGDHRGFPGGWQHRHGGFPGGLAVGAIGPVYDNSGGYPEAPAPSIWFAPSR